VQTESTTNDSALTNIRSEDNEIAGMAIWRLRPEFISDAVPVLLEILAGPERRFLGGDASLETVAQEKLLQLSDLAMPRLIDSLGQSSPDIRVVATHELSRLIRNDERLAKHLVKALSSDDSRVRLGCVLALRMSGQTSNSTIDALRLAVHDADDAVSAAATEAVKDAERHP
jgi:hypothetical protein